MPASGCRRRSIAPSPIAVYPHLCAAKDRVSAYRKAILNLGVPFSLLYGLQAAGALIYVPIVFGEAWAPASPLVAILCLGGPARLMVDAARMRARAGRPVRPGLQNFARPFIQCAAAIPGPFGTWTVRSRGGFSCDGISLRHRRHTDDERQTFNSEIRNRRSRNMTRRPTVSIIMPAYRARDTIAESIRSVQAQTLNQWELIIVDDGSPDDTAEVAKDMTQSDPRVCVVQRCNRGPSIARNSGVDLARAENIAFLDADDLWAPERLAGMVEMFAQNPRARCAV